jgi:hypothetical protein
VLVGLVRALIVLLVSPLAVLAHHDTSVHFDVSPTVGCERVEGCDAQTEAHDSVRVEGRFDISLLVTGGAPRRITECLYHIYHPYGGLQIVDYAPRTTLTTDVVGNLQVERKEERGGGISLTAGTDWDVPVHGQAAASGEKKTSSVVRYEMLPQQEMLWAAGTFGRGSGVYFKTKWSSQLPLEGSRTFSLVFQVPRTWRADYVRVICQAQDAEGKVIATASFLTPLFLAADEEAAQRAEELIAAEHRFLAAARGNGRALRKAAYPTVAHELSLLPSPIPPNWLESIVWEQSSESAAEYEARLPAQVRAAIDEYRRAKRAVAEMAGG